MFMEIKDSARRSIGSPIDVPFSPAGDMLNPAKRLIYWITEREKIRIKRRQGLPYPWTKDPILRQYKFCNVRREDDAVTLWIKEHWRDPHYQDPRMWHTMAVARLINWPPTLAAIGYPMPWRPNRFRKIMSERRANKEQVFTGAYMITNAGQTMSKVDTVIYMLDNLDKLEPCPTKRSTLQETHALLMDSNHCGMGSFMAAQVVADCKQTGLLAEAKDWWDWCAPGPGSQRGLSRLFGVEFRRFRQDEFLEHLISLREEIEKKIEIDLCLQDLQSCLCEFDKFERTLWGEGRPRSIYRPNHEKEF